MNKVYLLYIPDYGDPVLAVKFRDDIDQTDMDHYEMVQAAWTRYSKQEDFDEEGPIYFDEVRRHMFELFDIEIEEVELNHVDINE